MFTDRRILFVVALSVIMLFPLVFEVPFLRNPSDDTSTLVIRKESIPSKSVEPEHHHISGDKHELIPSMMTHRHKFYEKGEALDGYYNKEKCTPPSHWSDFSSVVEQEQECIDVPQDDGLAKLRESIKERLKARRLTVVVWFFAGRKGYVDVNLPYIKSVIKANGGIVDHVLWIYLLKQDYILDIVKAEPSGQFKAYKRTHTIRRMYRNSKPNTIYVKIDDDVVFIRPGSVEYLVDHWLDNPERCKYVSGNIINNPGLTPVHQYMGALDALPFKSLYDGRNGLLGGSYQSALEWAWSHVNFLRRLITHTFNRYDFGTWDFNCDNVYRRWTINMIAYQMEAGAAHEMRSVESNNKDEVYFTWMRPEKEGTHTCSVGKALAVHFFHTAQTRYVRRRTPEGVNATAGLHPLLAEYVLSLYKAVSRHVSGEEKCCKASGCPLYSMDLKKVLKDLTWVAPK